MSEPRLNRGKEKLMGLLQGKIRFTESSVKEINDASLKKEGRPISEGLSPVFQERIHKQFMDKHFSDWINTPLPALNGQTPRSAVRSPEGRRKVETLLKDFENTEEHQKKDGEHWYDIGKVKKILGF